jgi:predicted nucleotidyltransferase
MDIPHLNTPPERIEAFCRKWKITEFALFGSILTDEFRPDSDVDVLVTFAEDARWTLFDVGDMREELREIFGREVDLVNKKALRNPFRKHHILSHKRVFYAA